MHTDRLIYVELFFIFYLFCGEGGVDSLINFVLGLNLRGK